MERFDGYDTPLASDTTNAGNPAPFMVGAYIAGVAAAGARRAQRAGNSPAQGAADAVATDVADTVYGFLDLAACLWLFVLIASAMNTVVGGYLLLLAAVPVWFIRKQGFLAPVAVVTFLGCLLTGYFPGS